MPLDRQPGPRDSPVHVEWGEVGPDRVWTEPPSRSEETVKDGTPDLFLDWTVSESQGGVFTCVTVRNDERTALVICPPRTRVPWHGPYVTHGSSVLGEEQLEYVDNGTKRKERVQT